MTRLRTRRERPSRLRQAWRAARGRHFGRPPRSAAGLIRYRRGHIAILDREGLEASACECYRVVKDEFDRLLGRGWSSD